MSLHCGQNQQKGAHSKALRIKRQVPRPAEAHLRSGIEIIYVQQISPPVFRAVVLQLFVGVSGRSLAVVCEGNCSS